MDEKVVIRPFEKTDDEYAAVVALSRAVWPDYQETVEEWKHNDETRDPQYPFQRLVAEIEGKIVASAIYCEPAWSYRPGKFFIMGSVHPDHRAQGIGTALYDHIMERLAERDPVTLTSASRENQVAGIRFLTRRGFQQTLRAPVSQLDVPNFQEEKYAGLAEKMEKQGIKILSLREIDALDPDWKRKLWELKWELLQDVPTTDQLTKQPFEVFVERSLGRPGFNPDAQFVAMDGDCWVGATALWVAQAEPEKLHTGLTGVVRSHRRRGIATAMKVRSIVFARQYGTKIIETDNEENNPMYQLNLQLGFQPKPAWLDFEKQLRPADQEKS